MNKEEIMLGLFSPVKEKHDVTKLEIRALPKDRPTERGALQLKAGIYNVAISAGLLCGNENGISLMERRFASLITAFPEISEHYESLPEEEKNIMAVALYPETFMRVHFYVTYCMELAEAEKEGNAEKLFKARIKKEVLGEILDTWRTFRVQRGLFAFAFADKEE